MKNDEELLRTFVLHFLVSDRTILHPQPIKLDNAEGTLEAISRFKCHFLPWCHPAITQPCPPPPWCVECCVRTADGDILTPGDDARYTDKLLFKALAGLRQLFHRFLATIKFLL